MLTTQSASSTLKTYSHQQEMDVYPKPKPRSSSKWLSFSWFHFLAINFWQSFYFTLLETNISHLGYKDNHLQKWYKQGIQKIYDHAMFCSKSVVPIWISVASYFTQKVYPLKSNIPKKTPWFLAQDTIYKMSSFWLCMDIHSWKTSRIYSKHLPITILRKVNIRGNNGNWRCSSKTRNLKS